MVAPMQFSPEYPRLSSRTISMSVRPEQTLGFGYVVNRVGSTTITERGSVGLELDPPKPDRPKGTGHPTELRQNDPVA